MQYLYRAYSEDEELLYIGISNAWHERLHAHEKTSEWIEKADWVKIERYPDRASVCAAEKEAIQNERPRYNKVFSVNWVAPHQHWKELRKWIHTGEAPDEFHQTLINGIREALTLIYENDLKKAKSAALAWLYLHEIEYLVYHKVDICRNCTGLWNSSIIQYGSEHGEDQLIEGIRANGTY